MKVWEGPAPTQVGKTKRKTNLSLQRLSGKYPMYIYIYIILYSEEMVERGEAIAELWRGDGEAVAKRWRSVAKW